MTESVRDIKERVADIIWKRHGYYYDRVSAVNAAEKLLALDLLKSHFLSLPSGLRAVRECEHYAKGFADELCESCHGSGLISRDIPISEAVDILKMIVRNKSLKAPYLRISSGERVEVGE